MPLSWLLLCGQTLTSCAWLCRVLRCGDAAKAEALLRRFKGQQLEVESAITAARIQVRSSLHVFVPLLNEYGSYPYESCRPVCRQMRERCCGLRQSSGAPGVMLARAESGILMKLSFQLPLLLSLSWAQH